MQNKKSENEDLVAFALKAGDIALRYKMLKRAADELLAHYHAIRSKGWCEPALQSSIEDLDALCDAINQTDEKEAQ